MGKGTMRFWPLFSLLLLSTCVRSALPHELAPVHDTAISVAATPVALDSANPARRLLGPLTYLGGWQLTSNGPWFGGLSGLSADGDHLTAVSDAGAIIEFDIGRFGHVSNAHIQPIPARCGSGGDKADRDSESVTFDPLSGDWWIGLEGQNAICRASNDFAKVLGFARPHAMRGWTFNYGPETLLRLADGRFVALAEGAPDGGDVRPLLVFDRDPTNAGVVTARLGYRPPEGFSPTDAAQLPDGRLLVLNRRFRPWSLFTAVLTLVDTRTLQPGAIVTGKELARFEPPVIAENYEGIAVTQEEGRTIAWILCDDNFGSWQRTLLLKFALPAPESL